jgi:hypothetical protein
LQRCKPDIQDLLQLLRPGLVRLRWVLLPVLQVEQVLHRPVRVQHQVAPVLLLLAFHFPLAVLLFPEPEQLQLLQVQLQAALRQRVVLLREVVPRIVQPEVLLPLAVV